MKKFFNYLIIIIHNKNKIKEIVNIIFPVIKLNAIILDTINYLRYNSSYVNKSSGFESQLQFGITSHYHYHLAN